MLLSVIIVSYRVPYFLGLCLRSVRAAVEGLEAEIIVVDNHSGDGTVDLLRPLFPGVKWVVNDDNIGFARANNVGFRRSSGEYILFLNPDTILPEDFAARCLECFSSSTPGAIGVRMIDGDGQFLKESRRGVPTPWVAFCRLSGLAALFPRSPRFARYYLGHLPADQSGPAPVLSGACLLVSRAALEKTGPFDETFFMYAEDIDLSYRLEKAGFNNVYFPGTTIVHFKGESTQRDIRYTRQFYKAMVQFRRKHFRSGMRGGFLLDAAIWLRGALSAVGKPFRRNEGSGQVRGARGSNEIRRVWLTGDREGIAQLRPALQKSEDTRIEARSIEVADKIIYCIGKEFSFKSAIEALQRKNPDQSAAFYVDGGLAVVGSSRSDRQGEVWILQGKLPDQAR